MTIAVNRNLSNCENSPPKKVFRGFNGIRTRGLCVSAAVLSQLSYEDSYTGGWPIYWVHQPVKGMKHWMKWCELREYKWNEYVTIAVNRNLSNCENSPKKSFSGLQRDSSSSIRERNETLNEMTVRIPLKPRKKLFWGLFSQLLKLRFTAMVTYSFHLYSRSSHHFIHLFIPIERELPRAHESCRQHRGVVESARESPRAHGSCRELTRVAESARALSRAHGSCPERTRVTGSPRELPRAHGSRRECTRVAESARESPRAHESRRESTRVVESGREFELLSNTRKIWADLHLLRSLSFR